MRRPLLSLAAACAAAACGPRGPQVPAGPDPCEVAAVTLKGRLGPELAAIDARLNLPLGPTSRGGCALVYRPRPEELAEEVDEVDSGTDHQLAIALPDAQGQLALALIPASQPAPGPVSVKLGLKDVTGDGRPELISVEDAGMIGDAYRGLRVFTYAAGAAAARQVLDTRLVVTTPEGLEIIPDWRPVREGERPAILLDGAGTFQVFSWDPSQQRFALDAAATAARNPKPAPPEAPTPDAASGGAAAEPAAPPGEGAKVPVIDLP